jgi:DNA-binding transcriptional MocR family regulator
MSVPIQYGITGTTAREIAASIESGIQAGRLPAGSPLPPVRALSTLLDVSPATAAAAYRTLGTRGLLSAHGRRGTRVSHRPPLQTRAPLEVPGSLRNLAEGNPDPALLPRLRRALAGLDDRPRLYGEKTHRPELLDRASRQLERDGVPAGAVTVVGGALDGIERVLQVHLRPGDRVAVEDPGYSGILDLAGALGLVLEPMAVDDLGPLPEHVARVLRAGVEALILTPRAQNPYGSALDPLRARELRGLLEVDPRVLLVEDDHAGPVSGAPAVTLAHRGRERWAVVRSVSKALGPDLRLAVLAADPLTIARVEGRQALGSGWVSHLLQGVVLGLWSDPRTDELLRAATEAYAARRNALVAALRKHGIEAHGRSGLNVWVHVPEEAQVVTMLATAGWAVRGGERYRIKSPPAVRITTAALRPGEADRLAIDLARCLAPRGRSRSA